MSHPPLPELLQALRTVQGWLSDEDVALFFAVDDATRALGVTGDVVEIGAYKGKSAVVLGYCVGEGEEVVVVDPFGQPAGDDTVLAEQHRHYADLNRATFEANYARFHPRAPRVIEDFSTNLSPAGLGANARLIHVDGAHDFASLEHDIDLAVGVLVEGGVAVFDDALNAGAPGVAAAVWGAVHDGRLVPLMTTGKLWLCQPIWHERLFDVLEDQLTSRGEIAFSFEVVGSTKSMRVHPRSAPDPSRARRIRGLVTPPIVPLARQRLRSMMNTGSRGDDHRAVP